MWQTTARTLWAILHSIGAVVIPTDPTAFWTCILASGTVALAIMAWRGLRSLKLARTDMLTRATREALATATARAEEWALEILPANAAVLTKLSEQKIPVFVENPSEVNFDMVDEAEIQRALKWRNDLPRDILIPSMELLNRIEAWVLPFTNGLADEAVIFEPCAPSFCSIIVRNYALLLAAKGRASSGKYPNTLWLFHTWLEKLKRSEEKGLELEELVAQILSRVQTLQRLGPASEVPPHRRPLPKPVGMEEPK